MRSSSIEGARGRPLSLRVTAWLLLAVMCLIPGPAIALTELAVTVDDLPATGPLPPGMTRLSIINHMIHTLRRHSVPGVYGFTNGGQVHDNPELEEILRAWHTGGFLLGNHTFSHLDLNRVSADEFIADIERNEPWLARWSPLQPLKYFRYPYLHQGNTSDKQGTVRRWLTSHGYRVAQVTVYVEHWEWSDAYVRCAARHDQPAIAHMKDMFLAVSRARLAWSRDLSERLFKRQIKHVLLLHAEPFDALMLDELLSAYQADGVALTGLQSAVQDPAYARYLDAPGDGDRTFLRQVAQAQGVDIPPLPPGAPPELDRICR